MFPPAELPLDAALQKTVERPLKRPDLVAVDLVCPISQLADLTPERLRRHGHDGPFTVAVVGPTAENVVADAERVKAEAPEGVEVVRFEVAMLEPAAVALVEQARDILPESEFFLEPRFDDGAWPKRIGGLFQLLKGLPGVGLKIRCAGPTAVTHLTLAHILRRVAASRTPLKITQGLHHPILEELDHNEHGFLNIAVALRLLQGGERLDDEALLSILMNHDPTAFTFDAGIGYKGHVLTEEQFTAALSIPFVIGSCDVAEPDADLARLYP